MRLGVMTAGAMSVPQATPVQGARRGRNVRHGGRMGIVAAAVVHHGVTVPVMVVADRTRDGRPTATGEPKVTAAPTTTGAGRRTAEHRATGTRDRRAGADPSGTPEQLAVARAVGTRRMTAGERLIGGSPVSVAGRKAPGPIVPPVPGAAGLPRPREAGGLRRVAIATTHLAGPGGGEQQTSVAASAVRTRSARGLTGARRPGRSARGPAAIVEAGPAGRTPAGGTGPIAMQRAAVLTPAAAEARAVTARVQAASPASEPPGAAPIGARRARTHGTRLPGVGETEAMRVRPRVPPRSAAGVTAPTGIELAAATAVMTVVGTAGAGKGIAPNRSDLSRAAAPATGTGAIAVGTLGSAPTVARAAAGRRVVTGIVAPATAPSGGRRTAEVVGSAPSDARRRA